MISTGGRWLGWEAVEFLLKREEGSWVEEDLVLARKTKTLSLAGKETKAMVGGEILRLGAGRGEFTRTPGDGLQAQQPVWLALGSAGSQQHGGLQSNSEAEYQSLGSGVPRAWPACRQSLRNNRKNTADQSDTIRRKSAN